MPKPISGTFAGEVIDASDLYIARVIEDSIDNYVCEEPFLFMPTASVANATATNQATSYYSGRPIWVYTSEGVTTLTLVTPYPTTEMEALALGKSFDQTTGRMIDSGQAEPVYFALLYKTPMSDGNFAYECWGKGVLSVPSQNRGETRGENISPQKYTWNYAAISTIHKFEIQGQSEKDGFKRIQGDSTHPNFNPAGWFGAVQTPETIAPVPIKKYKVQIKPDSEADGKVSVSPTGSQPKDAVLTITATPAAGKTFDQWTSDAGGTFADDTNPITTFTVPENDVVITASFTT